MAYERPVNMAEIFIMATLINMAMIILGSRVVKPYVFLRNSGLSPQTFCTFLREFSSDRR
jgi:hypothetical protein